MARYTDADCKRCRREKMKLFLKGAKCESPKCPFEKRPYPPGQHGRGRTKESEYLLQLREKQKATRMYGVLEKQFSTIAGVSTMSSTSTYGNTSIVLQFDLNRSIDGAALEWFGARGIADRQACSGQRTQHVRNIRLKQSRRLHLCNG